MDRYTHLLDDYLLSLIKAFSDSSDCGNTYSKGFEGSLSQYRRAAHEIKYERLSVPIDKYFMSKINESNVDSSNPLFIPMITFIKMKRYELNEHVAHASSAICEFREYRL